ncbi:uncharacterized protein LOC131169402 [Hevea brasiliensis]|uniref:uncharacterized protein LOC131169402 n=1 Tax=Hevea brasiliensis TaxID=3981 RepID=UPI0025F38111|nr:uncharacterized protein LOC131169402 [Hevea brasiliensis]
MHYQRMVQRYYLLNGYNDINLWHTYITSLPEALKPELHRSIAATLHAMNGEIHQMTLACLEKMCEQQKLFKDIIDNKSSESDSEAHYPFYLAQKIQSSRPTYNPNTITIPIPIPLVPLHVLPSKYKRPINVIGFLDTGAHKSMMNPAILPPEYWVPHTEYFKAADGNIFKTSLITKQPIGIQFFPTCILWTKIIGSDLSEKDLPIGFDFYQQAKHLKILPRGLKYKRHFQPFTSVPKLYSLADASMEFQEHKELLLKYCANSHAQFHHHHPLWRNPEFFIHLLFKLNEDINPTKASHPRMNPADLALAQEECKQLLQQGLIEATSSPWACQAFYVEKRSEKLRGKKRLVIDYKPLNHFLQDDKFPLPKPEALFTQLHEAHIFSKFDLKTNFWQLGIEPTDRPKTAFCIPTAQYQWIVLPFGLKIAPFVFQKAMKKIFDPILQSVLIYIDDILLFSKDVMAHKALLTTFQSIVESYGIMLSEKKSSLAQSDIDFLGMRFKDGRYQPGPHIAEELLKFSDKDLSIK